MNRKPDEKLEHVLEEDSDRVEAIRFQYLNRKRREVKLPDVNPEYLPTELDEDLDEIEFKDHKSSASCHVDDILGFNYGGQTSRFWVHRKHVNSLPPDQLE